jgi:hypothetical protein
VALIGNGVEILVIAERADGYEVTGAAESQTALVEAKASWVDAPVVLSNNVLTGSGADLPQFIAEMTDLFLGQELVKDAA